MEVYRIEISSWTASFRYPNLISGVQPTLEVPPVSTVLGILNAAAGKYLQHQNLEIGYYFEYAGKTFDLETIYMIHSDSKGNPSNKGKSNVIKREFLADGKLILFLKDKELVDYLRRPYYDILLGRSGDLAMVSVEEELFDLEKVEKANKIKGQIIPFGKNLLPGKIQALPQYFSNDFPRKNLGTMPYSIVKHGVPDFGTKMTAYRDKSLGRNGVDIYFHQLNFDNNG
jgi:CRISPR-associated protein Cas5t